MNQRKKALIIFTITVGFLTFVTVFGIVVTDGARVTDFSKKNMVKIFINHLEKKKFCILEEFLFIDTKHPFVKRGDNRFTHELILCLHKT